MSTFNRKRQIMEHEPKPIEQNEIIEIIEMVMQISGCDRPEYDSPALKMFETFAKLVAAKEREACAKVCDFEWGTPAQKDLGVMFAKAIRARGEA